MANIWKQNREVTQKVKRNNHDLSFDNHATFKLGYLYPVFCKFTVPGDSFRIRSAFDLKLMPLVFPLQSKLRANLHFFYVRAKNCWPEIEDYLTGISRSTPLVEPYIAPDDSKVKTGSIYDFLGVPTTLVTKSAIVNRSLLLYGASSQIKSKNVLLTCTVSNDPIYSISVSSEGASGRPLLLVDYNLDYGDPTFGVDFRDIISDLLDFDYSTVTFYVIAFNRDNGRLYFLYSSTSGHTFSKVDDISGSSLSDFEALEDISSFDFGVTTNYAGDASVTEKVLFDYDLFNESFYVGINIPAGFSEYSTLDLNLYKDKIHLKALPFRAYESCYRAYYANDILQPLIDSNGDAQYNKYCSTQAGGLDTTDYHLFKRNYELDFLTSAYPSPQAGPAPLVGMSALGNITIEDENGITTAKAEVDGDGHITGVSITSPLASIEHGRTLVNLANIGMSINDFRNANALQKFLEQTLRSGYRYIDFIKGQWGVKPKDQALDMPEFLGGFSREVAIQTITSLADTGSSSLSSTLGGFGANGRVLGGSNFAVSKFCDDYGYIIGIMCVTPTPAYSQLLNKQMIAGDNYLSFPFPQFNQLGMQPIPYKEVAPIQAYLDELEDPSKSLEDCFGYQRPNYDLVGSVDEVHGEFRGSLRNYLINRIFDGRPELGSSFIEIDPSEVNDVFVNQNPDDDVLIGHLRFKVDTKRPFPRIHFPSL